MTAVRPQSAGKAIERTDVVSVLSLISVSFRYASGPFWARRHVDAVRGVNLEIAEGQTVGLVGESGSGKTTLGRLALGLLHPSRGHALIDGIPQGQEHRSLRGKSQVVLQNPEWSLNPRLRVETSIAEPLAVLRAGNRTERRARVHSMLDHLGLESSLASRFPHELSGGQLQRMAIARALITFPRFVVFDEAVSALDVSVQTQILNLIKTTQVDRAFAALFISHDLAAVRYVADSIAVMYAGEIVELAPSHRFYARPRHPYGRALQLSIMEGNEAFQLKGEPGPIPSTGCPLSPRCPMAIQRCRIEKPDLRLVDNELVACHRAEEVGER